MSHTIVFCHNHYEDDPITIIKEVLSMSLKNHVTGNGLCVKFQPSFKRKLQWREFTLTVSRTLTLKKCVIVVLLDLLAVFDNIDILIPRHECFFHINGNALKWLKSSLSIDLNVCLSMDMFHQNLSLYLEPLMGPSWLPFYLLCIFSPFVLSLMD